MRLASKMLFFTRSLLAPAVLVLLLGRPTWAQLHAVGQSDLLAPGCYRLTLGSWSRASRLGPAEPTAVVRLDTIARKRGVPGDLVAERIDPAVFGPPGDLRLRWQQPARWRHFGADSVVIVTWSTGTEAEKFFGRRVGRSLKGVVRRTSDAIPVDPLTRKIQWNSWPWADAVAVPVSCP